MSQDAPRDGDGSPRLALVVAALALVALLLVAAFHTVRHDDAFITYRYGQNLATGDGLTFNPGERLMGSTSPLHSLISAAVYALAGQQATPSVMAALGCLAWVAQALVAFLLLHPPLGRWPAFLVALALAAGGAWSFEWVALETHLVAAAVLASLLAGVRGRWVAAAALLAVAGLLRPDAYLAALPLGLLAVADLRAGRTRPLAPVAAFAALSAPWYLFAALYFGTVLPHSFNAKVGKAGVADYLAHLAGEAVGGLTAGYDGVLWGLFAWLFVVLGAVLLVRRAPRLWVLPAWGLAHAAAYLWLRPFVEHRWHLYPVALVGTLCGLAAVACAAHLLPRDRGLEIAIVILLALTSLYARRTVRWAVNGQDGYWWGDRNEVYRQVADLLRREGDPAAERVASVEVGTLAYYSDFRMFDLGGIVTAAPEDPTDVPPLDWFVTDPAYLDSAPRGQRPVAIVRGDEFVAFVFRLSPGSPRRSSPSATP